MWLLATICVNVKPQIFLYPNIYHTLDGRWKFELFSKRLQFRAAFRKRSFRKCQQYDLEKLQQSRLSEAKIVVYKLKFVVNTITNERNIRRILDLCKEDVTGFSKFQNDGSLK